MPISLWLWLWVWQKKGTMPLLKFNKYFDWQFGSSNQKNTTYFFSFHLFTFDLIRRFSLWLWLLGLKRSLEKKPGSGAWIPKLFCHHFPKGFENVFTMIWVHSRGVCIFGNYLSDDELTWVYILSSNHWISLVLILEVL